MDQYRPGVLLAVSSLAAGGAEKHAIALANLLDTTRFRLTLCCVRAGDTLAAELDASRLEALLSLDVRQKFSWRAVERLAREIDRQCIDIVVCANGYPVLYALAASLRARRRVRVVEVFHTTRPGSLKGARPHAAQLDSFPSLRAADLCQPRAAPLLACAGIARTTRCRHPERRGHRALHGSTDQRAASADTRRIRLCPR